MLENIFVGIREMVANLNISYGSTQHNLVDDLEMERVNARFVPRDLNLTYIKHIVSGDETWVYRYDVETAQQSGEWHSKNESKPKASKLAEYTEGHPSRAL